MTVFHGKRKLTASSLLAIYFQSNILVEEERFLGTIFDSIIESGSFPENFSHHAFFLGHSQMRRHGANSNISEPPGTNKVPRQYKYRILNQRQERI